MAEKSAPNDGGTTGSNRAGIFGGRRKLRSFWIRPAMQIRFFLHAIGIASLSLGLGVGVAIIRMSALQGAAVEDPHLTAVHAQSLSAVIVSVSAAMAIFGALILAITAIYAHRVAGPMVPLERALDAMIAGDYSFRVRLRKSDEFQDLAKKINQLAESLESGRLKR